MVTTGRVGILRLCGAYAPTPLRMTSFEIVSNSPFAKNAKAWGTHGYVNERKGGKSGAPRLSPTPIYLRAREWASSACISLCSFFQGEAFGAAFTRAR